MAWVAYVLNLSTGSWHSQNKGNRNSQFSRLYWFDPIYLICHMSSLVIEKPKPKAWWKLIALKELDYRFLLVWPGSPGHSIYFQWLSCDQDKISEISFKWLLHRLNNVKQKHLQLTSLSNTFRTFQSNLCSEANRFYGASYPLRGV